MGKESFEKRFEDIIEKELRWRTAMSTFEGKNLKYLAERNKLLESRLSPSDVDDLIKMQSKNLEALKEVEELEKEYVDAKKELSTLLHSVTGNNRIFARIPRSGKGSDIEYQFWSENGELEYQAQT